MIDMWVSGAEVLTAAIMLLPFAIAIYAFVLYPVLLWCVGAPRTVSSRASGDRLPTVTVVIIAYNEARSIGHALEALLASDYPSHLLDVVVVSDCSTDGTDDVVRGYGEHRVRLVSTPRRMGKTAAENLFLHLCSGEVIVNTDAAVRVHPGAIRALVGALGDGVGLASGVDASVPSAVNESNRGQGLYVRYEMWIRSLETRADGIVGASGCLFAIRRDLHAIEVPANAVRDFAAPLMVRTHGARSVSVPSALCFVPRTASLRGEYRRKVRTFMLGLETLWWQRRHLNPLHGALFAWKLFSHKLCRWLLPWSIAFALVAGTIAGPPWARVLTVGSMLLGFGCVVAAGLWAMRESPPRLLALAALSVASAVAVLEATIRYLSGDRRPIWEPTRRSAHWFDRGAGESSRVAAGGEERT